MAPTANGPKTQLPARKPLIQPALPALPLILNAKRQKSFGSGTVTPTTEEKTATGVEQVSVSSPNDPISSNGSVGTESERHVAHVAQEADIQTVEPTPEPSDLSSAIPELDTPILSNHGVDAQTEDKEKNGPLEESDLNHAEAIKPNSRLTIPTTMAEGSDRKAYVEECQSPSGQAPEVNINHVADPVNSENSGLTFDQSSPHTPHRSRPLTPSTMTELGGLPIPSPIPNGMINHNTPQIRSNNQIPFDSGHQIPPLHMRVNSGVSRVSSVSMPNGHNTSPGLTNDISGSEQSQISFALPTLASHLLHLSTSKSWADWMIEVKPPRSAFPFISYGHGMVLCRSLRLQSLMSQAQDAYSSNLINLQPPRMINPHAFEAALRFFYSDTVLSEEGILPSDPHASIQTARPQMYEYIVSYWISGIELGLAPVSQRAAKILPDLIGWDVLEQATKDGLELISFSDSPLNKQGIESEYTKAGTQILRTVARFISYRMDPTDFVLDTSAYSEALLPRLPDLDGTRPRANPALASMVFGSMPAHTTPPNTRPNLNHTNSKNGFSDGVVSKILLNVNFDVLRLFANQLFEVRGPAASPLVSQVIEERESRRNRAVTAIKSGLGDPRNIDPTLWPALDYQESFEGNVLRRELVSPS